MPPTDLFDKFLLTSFAINVPQNVTNGVQTNTILLAPLAALFCTFTKFENGAAARDCNG